MFVLRTEMYVGPRHLGETRHFGQFSADGSLSVPRPRGSPAADRQPGRLLAIVELQI